MITLLAILIGLQAILLWGAWSRLHDLELKLFQMEHPRMFREDDIIASYLGKADE